MPDRTSLTEAGQMRRKALSRWENEGGADPCGPQVPGVEKDCAEEESARGRETNRSTKSD